MSLDTLQTASWLPIVEAAEALSVSPDTIRRRLKAGELQGRPERTAHGFRWLVNIEAVSKLADGDTEASAQASAEAQAPSAESHAEASADEPMTLREQRLWNQLLEKDRQISELHVLLQRALEQRPALVLPAAPIEQPHQPSPEPARRSWWQRFVWGPI